jgi:hypothetical protein
MELMAPIHVFDNIPHMPCNLKQVLSVEEWICGCTEKYLWQ